jgi:hypothetical protein
MVDNQPIIPQIKGTGDVDEEKRKYKRLVAKRGLFLGLSLILLFVIAGIALSLGSADMTFFDAYAAVFA